MNGYTPMGRLAQAAALAVIIAIAVIAIWILAGR